MESGLSVHKTSMKYSCTSGVDNGLATRPSRRVKLPSNCLLMCLSVFLPCPYEAFEAARWTHDAAVPGTLLQMDRGNIDHSRALRNPVAGLSDLAKKERRPSFSKS